MGDDAGKELSITEQRNQDQNLTVSIELLREKIRNYSHEQRVKRRVIEIDALRFGLGEIQKEVVELADLTEKDVSGLATRIKRRKHATVEDMYRLSHAFLQGNENIRTFSMIPGAIQVIVKELTGHDSERQLGASECFCNLSLGEGPTCEKITNFAGSYLVTYLDSSAEQLKRTSLWTLANILASGGKAAQPLIRMKLIQKLWNLYVADEKLYASDGLDDYREDSAICLQLIALQSKTLLADEERDFIRMNLVKKNPTCVAAEFHLQILFHCEIITTTSEITEEQLLYLLNFVLGNFSNATDFTSLSNRLRVLYAVRILSNLLATHKDAHNYLLRQLSIVWHTNLIRILNKLFAFKNSHLIRETFWLLKNLLEAQQKDGMETSLMNSTFLDKLEVPVSVENLSWPPSNVVSSMEI